MTFYDSMLNPVSEGLASITQSSSAHGAFLRAIERCCDSYLGTIAALKLDARLKIVSAALWGQILPKSDLPNQASKPPECTSGAQPRAELASGQSVVSEPSPWETSTQGGTLSLESFSAASPQRTEEFRCAIIPSMEFTGRGFIFVNGTRSTEHQLQDWIMEPDVTDSLTEHDMPPTALPELANETVELLEEADGVYTVKYPLRRTQCRTCMERFNNIPACVSHVEARHQGQVRFVCGKCKKSYPKHNRVAIHHGKCKGGALPRNGMNTGNGEGSPQPTQTTTQNRFEILNEELNEDAVPNEEPQEVNEVVAETADYNCEVCQSRFGTKIGLGQHIRHQHPDLANQKRIAAVQNDIERKRNVRKEKAKASTRTSNTQPNAKVKASAWSQEEVDLPIALDIKHHGARHRNKLIAEELKSKTSKQISDKRRTLNKLSSD